MYFSPRKFLISTRVPVSWMTTLMGKWAYTERILYRKPCRRTEARREMKSNNKAVKKEARRRNHDCTNPSIKAGHRAYYSSWTWSVGRCTHQSDPLDHVLDVAADGADCGQLLPVTPPFIYTKLRKTVETLR